MPAAVGKQREIREELDVATRLTYADRDRSVAIHNYRRLRDDLLEIAYQGLAITGRRG